MRSFKYFNLGKVMYLVGLAELAIYNFFKGDFAMTRPPKSPSFLVELNPGLAYISGAFLLICIFLIVINKSRPAAIYSIVVTIFICATSRHVFELWKDPINGFKTLWLMGGALLILCSTLDDRRTKPIVFFNIIVLFMFFYLCAVAHFQFADFVQSLIPAYIPFPIFWTYFAGVCLLSAGVGLLVTKIRRLALLLSAIQIAGWFILLHIPRALQIGGDEWIGVGESLAVSGICFMIYELVPVSPQTLHSPSNQI
jgi:uncharacterized membrane protein